MFQFMIFMAVYWRFCTAEPAKINWIDTVSSCDNYLWIDG